jgi:hypothetical protein
VREQHIVSEAVRVRWLLRSYRALVKVPSDIALVTAAAVTQLARPRRGSYGTLRSAPFDVPNGEEALAHGRIALAESAGSLAPNTIVIGVDEDRGAILVHQLWRTGGREAIDVLELG